MRFFTDRHQHYCGIDLHVKTMYLCIQNLEGQILLHRNTKAGPEAFLKAIKPFREDVVVGVECIFTWYWLADLCAQHNIPFILGHALYMKAIHGGKAKNDRIDSKKIAAINAWRNIPSRLRLSSQNESHQGSAQKAQSPDQKTGRPAKPHPEH